MKKFLAVFLLLTLVVGVFVFVGCGDKEVTADKLTVKFDPKGGAAIADLDIDENSLATLPTPTREGFVFQGWFMDEDFQTEATIAGLKEKLKDGTITIYAKWDAATPPTPASLTVHFNAKGGDAVQDTSIQADTAYTLPTARREGFNFGGWFFEESYQTAVTVDGLKAKIADGTVTIYAKWTEKSVTLSFNTKGGSAVPDRTVGAALIETIILPIPQKADNKFARWYFDENYQTAYSAQGLKAKLDDGTVTLYAKWGAIVSGDTVTMQGKVGDKAVLNPVFDWTNPYDDTGFGVILKAQDGSPIENVTVASTHFELVANLAYNTTYTLCITGLTSDCYREFAFETVSGSGEIDLNEATFALAEPFKSHMVIQRGKAINVVGMTAPGTLVSIDFYGERKYAVSNASTGMFSFSFAAKEANATPANITLNLLKNKSLVVEDVLIGDVYLVSGQSNVQRSLAECSVADVTPDWAADVNDAVTYGVRYYYQAENVSATPALTTKNSFWFKTDATDDQYKNYSAVAFMVGAMLGKGLADDAVPVGIIYAAKGNTNITSWKGDAGSQHYNGMIYPLSTAEISGVVWYQGCNNSGKGIDYQAHLVDLKSNWRTLFRNAELPFYVVQLPCYNGDSGNNYDFSYVRESQLKACEADENAYLIATCDGGDANDIHPKEKRYLCERIAKSILSTVYGQDYLPEGPTYASHEVQGSNVVITVKNGEGLNFTGDAIVGFQLAGADGKYFDATATISEGKLVVTSTEVATPVYIRYGFGKCPWLNVYNKDGFLMSPFRTDEYGHNIDLLDYREDAVYTSNPGGAAMTTEVVDVDGEVGLQVTKASGNSYGILELAKWGAIGYDEHALKLRIKGSNSGATLIFRIVEGSYEMWATPELTDDFTTVREMTLPISYFRVSSEGNGIIDWQSIWRVELIVKNKTEAVTVTMLAAKFVDYTRTAPAAFEIKDAKNDGTECTVKWGFSDFATSYQVIVSADGTDFTNPIYNATVTTLKTTFDASLCANNTTYYIKVIAINELGQTVVTNSSGIVLTGKTAPKAFTILDAKNDGTDCTVKCDAAVFASSYRVIVSADGTNFTNPIYDQTATGCEVTFASSLCAENIKYYVKVIAINELGETVATNSGIILKDVNKYVIADFEFASDSEFDSYVTNYVPHKTKLVLSCDDGKLKINVHESDSWAHCIIKTTNNANEGFDALKFYIDLREYKGYGVNIQLQDQYGSISFSYDLSFSSNREGYFTIPLSSFTSKTYGAFPGGAVGRIAFNFSDNVGGDEDNIYLDNVEYVKL